MPVTAADNTDPELPYAVNITLTCPQLRETVSKDRKEEEKETEKKDQADEKDSGESDSGVKDAGEKGAGEKDASEKDAGEKDAGEKDAGEKDAGEKDAGEKDADEKDADEKDADEKDAGEKDADQKDAGENDAAEDERALPLDKCLQVQHCVRSAHGNELGLATLFCHFHCRTGTGRDATCQVVCGDGSQRGLLRGVHSYYEGTLQPRRCMV